MSTEKTIAEIKRLYHTATAATIQRDLTRAIELARTLGSEEERERVAVYMDGLAQMRSEWALEAKRKGHGRPPAGAARKPRPPRRSRNRRG